MRTKTQLKIWTNKVEKKRVMVTPVRVNPVLLHPDEQRMNLAGEWRFRLDPDDTGVRKEWFRKPHILAEKIGVPGSWQGQGFGGDEEEEVWDFRLKARIFRASYQGTAWYGRAFTVPEQWREKQLWLLFGGAHPTAEVWVNGCKVGENHNPMVPFGFDITGISKPGKENFVLVRISEEDRIYGFSWNFQARWSGLYRNVELLATGDKSIDYCRIYPDLDEKTVTVKVRICGRARLKEETRLIISVRPADGTGRPRDVAVPVEDTGISEALKIPDAVPWTPDRPFLYRADMKILRGKEVLDARSERIGFVKIDTEGKHIRIGGEPYYLRGTGDFVHCPETGCPDTDRVRWRRKLKTLRDYGYNYVRCQSHVPVPEYMDAADEAGLIVQSEAGMLGAWGGMNQYHIYAWPQPLPAYREHLREQWNLVIRRDINHPCASIYCMSNELAAFPAGGKDDRSNTMFFPRTAWRCYEETKRLKPSAMVLWTDGGFSEILPADFLNTEAGMDKKTELPVIQHEFRWWSSFPDVRIIKKYSGALRHWSAEMALKAASERGISHILEKAAENSQRLQFIETKGKMENCRRDYPRLAGICHFDAMDAVPSPQGIIDEFYEKKYADSASWRQTNGDAVILSSLNFNDRVLIEGQAFSCNLSVSDFSHPHFREPLLRWRLIIGNKECSSGQIRYKHIPFRTCAAGKIKTEVPGVKTPVKGYLEAYLSEDKKSITNRWDLWVFPEAAVPSKELAVSGKPQDTWLKRYGRIPHFSRKDHVRLLFTEQFDGIAENFARSGGSVFVAAAEGTVRPFYPKLGLSEGRYFFTPPANYGPYEDGNNGTIILNHPMLGDFPHEGFADLQFYRMLAESPPLDLEYLGLNDGDPVIRAVHSYPLCRPIGYLLERRLGKGSVIISAIDFNRDWPEARYLLYQICGYVSGKKEKAPPLSETALAALHSAGELMKLSIPLKSRKAVKSRKRR